MTDSARPAEGTTSQVSAASGAAHNDRQVAAIDRHFLTIEDAAQLIGHGVSTLRRWITDGHLKPAGWVGRRAYYTERAILDAEHATRKRRAA